MRGLVRRLVFDERGQDLIEYALLTSFIGLAVIGAFDLIRTAVHDAYLSWIVHENNNWRPPDPTGS